MGKTTRGPYKPRSLPPQKTPETDDYVSKGDAISFITANITEHESEWRAVRDKVGKRISYAVQVGELHFTDDKILFGALMAWARDKPDWAPHLAQFPRIVNPRASETFSLSASSEALVLPETVGACHVALRQLHEQSQTATQCLAEALDEIQRLRPKAERYDEICATNKESGGKREL